MVAFLVLAVLAIAFAGVAVFAAMCVAIRHDDKKGLPGQAPTLSAARTRRFLGMTSGRPAPRSVTERELCTAGHVSRDQSADSGER
jgi:hypothetical protein